MSYILDALRRADAERERGAVPGLHSQPLAAPAANMPGTRRGAGVWIAVGAGAAVLLVAAAAWLLAVREHAAPAAAAAASTAVVAAPGTLNTTPPASNPPLTVPPAAAVPTTSAAAPNLVVPPPAAVQSTPVPAAAPPGPSTPATPSATVAGATPIPTATTPATASAAEPRITPYEQLPADVKRQLPTLAIGGTIYSDSPASRMLIVGGQLLHEGDTVAPGVTLERIKPKSAVLRWKDLRYEVAL